MMSYVDQPAFMANAPASTGQSIIVTAVAPMKANAPGDVMPLQAFVDLVISHTTTQESGLSQPLRK